MSQGKPEPVTQQYFSQLPVSQLHPASPQPVALVLPSLTHLSPCPARCPVSLKTALVLLLQSSDLAATLVYQSAPFITPPPPPLAPPRLLEPLELASDPWQQRACNAPAALGPVWSPSAARASSLPIPAGRGAAWGGSLRHSPVSKHHCFSTCLLISFHRAHSLSCCHLPSTDHSKPAGPAAVHLWVFKLQGEANGTPFSARKKALIRTSQR